MMRYAEIKSVWQWDSVQYSVSRIITSEAGVKAVIANDWLKFNLMPVLTSWWMVFRHYGYVGSQLPPSILIDCGATVSIAEAVRAASAMELATLRLFAAARFEHASIERSPAK